ncbi:MAG TPA: NADH-quinone oxidoreductase subunit M [Pantanalinema sp.]
MDQNVLSILIFLPVVAALGLMLMPSSSEKGIKGFAMVAALINAALALSLLGTFDPAKAGYQFEVNAPWLPSAGISYHLGIDGISLVLVVLTAVLTPVALLASWNLIKDRVRGYYAWMLLFSAGMIGAVTALDMFLFYVFFELMLIPAFFLIGLWGGEGRVKATVKFVVYTLVGSLFLFVAILYLAVRHQATTGTWSFQLADLMATPLAGSAMVWAFLAFALAFAIKSGLFPFHTWAPDTYVAAPAPVTFLVSGIMGKIGVYGFIRFAVPLFPEAARSAQPYLMGLALIGLIYAAWIALAQTDIKRLLAYSSVSHMAVILLGVFALDQHAWTGAVFMFMAHALATGGLFLLVGMLAERKGTSIADFGGIAKAMPFLTTVFVLVTMASVGLPGLNGFIGEFMILLGTYASHNVIGVVATTSVIWGACYMLWMVSRTFFGEEPKQAKPLADLSLREALVIVPIALVIVYTGFVPQPVLSRIDASVQAVLGPVNATVKAATAEPAATEGDHHAGGH